MAGEKDSGAETFHLICHIQFILLDKVVLSKFTVLGGGFVDLHPAYTVSQFHHAGNIYFAL
jgi:hypothetical protein